MALWCRHLPVVTVPRGTEPKNVTLVLPYYENPQCIASIQAPQWWAYPASLRAHLSIIVVDDGSPRPAVSPVLPLDLACSFRLFWIETDVRWNWLAARNIGAHHAAEGWLLLTDIDHVVPTETLAAVVYGQHDPKVVYAFSRAEHTGDVIAPHSASFLMTRAMFWRIGGYDETLSGLYGTDGEYRRRVAAVAKMRVLSDGLVRHEFVGDSSTSRYLRKQPEDAAVGRLVAARRPGWRPKTLSFPYHEVTL